MQQFTDWSALSTSWFYNIQKGSKNIIGLKSVVGMESLGNGKRTQKSSYFKKLWQSNWIKSPPTMIFEYNWLTIFSLCKLALMIHNIKDCSTGYYSHRINFNRFKPVYMKKLHWFLPDKNTAVNKVFQFESQNEIKNSAVVEKSRGRIIYQH